MRTVFGVLTLLIAVAIVGLIAKHELHAVSGSGMTERVNSAASAAGLALPPADSSAAQTPQQQRRNIEQQIKEATQQALQQGARRASDSSE